MSAKVEGFLFVGVRPVIVNEEVGDGETRHFRFQSCDPFGVDERTLAAFSVSSSPVVTAVVVEKSWEPVKQRQILLTGKGNVATANIPGIIGRVRHNGEGR